MTNDWISNAPNVKGHFNKTHEAQKTTTRRPVSLLEKQRLIAERDKPVLEQHLTPGGSLERAANRQTAARRELRIATITRRLDRMKGRARQDFSRSR